MTIVFVRCNMAHVAMKVEQKGRLVVITLDPDAERRPSSSGKMDLTVSGQWQESPTVPGFKFAVNAGYKAE